MKKQLLQKFFKTNLLLSLLLLSLLISACGKGLQGNKAIVNGIDGGIPKLSAPSGITFKQYDGKLLINLPLDATEVIDKTIKNNLFP